MGLIKGEKIRSPTLLWEKKEMSSHNMEGKKYRHSKFGEVQVTKQPNYKAGGPRNVLICLENGSEFVVPQRSLRKLKKEGKQKVKNIKR